MADSVDRLVTEFEQLVSALRSMEEQGKEFNKSSLSRAVDAQVGILENAIHRSVVDVDALMYAKQYGAMQPQQVAGIIRKIATAIDNSENPRADLVVKDIQRVINELK